jgi:hypothetical protein
MAATRIALTSLESVGLTAEDEAVAALRTKLDKQAAQLKKLKADVPKAGRKQTALVKARATFEDKHKGSADYAATCAAKAAERAEHREKLLQAMLATVHKLHDEAATETAKLKVAHAERAQQRQEFGMNVLEAMDEKITAMELEEVFSDAVSDHPEQTATEAERDEARSAAALAKERVARLEQAKNSEQQRHRPALQLQLRSPSLQPRWRRRSSR